MNVEAKEKAKEVETELEKCIKEIEQSLLSGDYSKTVKRVKLAKAYVNVIKVNKLWSRGNRYFALLSMIGEAKEAFEKKDLKNLETSLNSIEKTLLS